ncbi:MAG: hypothetical protein ACRDSK_02700 [Actinophytocola sp.]|uniref:hypothetical protein n=1 Tax=Actinophytocola sp. TaxID=1872138 RepID=UPI003D6BE887
MDEMFDRPPGGRGRRGVSRRAPRKSVPADGDRGDFDEDDGFDGFDGSAGVREPRHPKPFGPMSDAGALPLPEPTQLITLPDPRR